MTNTKPEFTRGPCESKCKHKTKDGYCKLIRCSKQEYPSECGSCFNHPSNGGSGFCNYIYGCAANFVERR